MSPVHTKDDSMGDGIRHVSSWPLQAGPGNMKAKEGRGPGGRTGIQTTIFAKPDKRKEPERRNAAE